MITRGAFFFFTFLSLTIWASDKAALVKLESGDHEPTAHLASQSKIIGIIEAGSTFANSGQGTSLVDTHGSASLVRLPMTQELVALTASHVVAGKNPWVKINDQKFGARKVFLDNDADIAIVSFAPSKAEPALLFDGKNLRISPRFMRALNAAQIPTVMLAYYQPNHALGFALRPWVDPGTETAFTRAIVNAPLVSLNFDGSQVRVHTKVTSGASGSAVLDLREQRVAGLIVQSHYYFSETYLASAEKLVASFKSYVTGKSGSISPTFWKMHNTLLYRVFPDDAEETNFTNHPTGGVIGQPGSGVIGQPGSGVIGQPGSGVIGQPGNGVVGEPGSGIIGQPGNGVVGQPGNGIVGQPGSGIIGQPGNGIVGQPGNGIVGQPGNGVIGQPGQKPKFLPWTEDPLAVFAFYNLKPGMTWHKQNIIGLKLQNKSKTNGWPAEFSLLAESEAFRFLHANSADFTATPVPLQTDYLALLRERLGIHDDREHRFEAAFGPNAVADDLELAPEPKECVLTLSKDGVHVRIKTFSRMNRETWKLVPDEIEFTLGRQGAPQGLEEFRPIIETKGLKSGEKYVVDLRKFYFSDLSQLIRPMPDWSKENPPFDFSRFDRERQLRTVGFSVRNAASGAEFTYGFATTPAPSADSQDH